MNEIIIILGVIVVILSFWTALTHALNYVRLGNSKRLMPLHVWAMAVGVLLATLRFVLVAFDVPVGDLTEIAFVALLLWTYGLIQIIRLQFQRGV